MSDPDRRYGFIATADRHGNSKAQYYSYLSEPEKERKTTWLRTHPDAEYPPGDPMNAPNDARFGSVSIIMNGHATTETYWYTTDGERDAITAWIRGE